jgi:hypothetical protein
VNEMGKLCDNWLMGLWARTKTLVGSVFLFSRDRQITIPTFKFELKFKLPNPRKSRIIYLRDEFGRIVFSKVPRLLEFA